MPLEVHIVRTDISAVSLTATTSSALEVCEPQYAVESFDCSQDSPHSLITLPATFSISFAESLRVSWPVNVLENSSPGCEGGQSARQHFFPLPVSDLSWVDAAPALLDIYWAPTK